MATKTNISVCKETMLLCNIYNALDDLRSFINEYHDTTTDTIPTDDIAKLQSLVRGKILESVDRSLTELKNTL